MPRRKDRKKRKDRKGKKRSKASRLTAATADRHALYEEAVQCVEADIDFVEQIFEARHHRKPVTLKEDFCGTAAAAAEFVRRRKENRAWGVDLDAETLDHGRARHIAPLGPDAERVTLLNADVLDVNKPHVDVILGMNFSYFVFKARGDLLRYFVNACASLKPGGMLVLDCYGGSEAQVPQFEEREYDDFTYIWDQDSYDPVTNEIVNHIHFKFPDGTRMKKAFTYEWRLWTPREITEALDEAGFRCSTVYWEGWDEDEEEGDGNFQPVTTAENCEGWIAYIVAER